MCAAGASSSQWGPTVNTGAYSPTSQDSTTTGLDDNLEMYFKNLKSEGDKPSTMVPVIPPPVPPSGYTTSGGHGYRNPPPAWTAEHTHYGYKWVFNTYSPTQVSLWGAGPPAGRTGGFGIYLPS